MDTAFRDDQVEKRIIVSLLTGQLVHRTAGAEVCALAEHLLDVYVDGESLAAVRWICDQGLRRLFEGTPLATAPTFPAEAHEVSDWLGAHTYIRMKETEHVKPLRAQLGSPKALDITSAYELLQQHPIAMIDLLAYLEQLRTPGYCSRLLDHRALSGAMPNVDFSKLFSELARFSTTVQTMHPRDWVDGLSGYSQDLRLVVGLADALNKADAEHTGLSQGYAVLPHERVVTLLIEQTRDRESDNAIRKAHEVYRRLQPVVQPA